MKRIELHFEHFVCDSDGGYCGSSGCLHEVWIFGRSHYHLSRSYYAPAGDAPAWLSGYGPSRQNAPRRRYVGNGGVDQTSLRTLQAVAIDQKLKLEMVRRLPPSLESRSFLVLRLGDRDHLSRICLELRFLAEQHIIGVKR
jgi:hypothetical protein